MTARDRRPRPVRRSPQRGVDDPSGARARDAAGAPRRLRPTRSPPQALAARDFVVVGQRRRAADERTLESCDVLVIAHPSDPAWERTTGIGSPRLSDERARRDRELRGARRRPDRARRDRAGQVRQQRQRAAGDVRPAPGQRHRAGLRALPRAPRAGSSPSSARAGAVARATCWPGSTRRACTGRRRSPRPTAPRVLARAHATARRRRARR